MADAPQLSQAAFDRLKSEHDDLTTRGRMISPARSRLPRVGTFENGDYHAAKEEQGKMEGRIMHLSRMIDNAVIVEAESGGDAVMTGAIVTIVFEGDDDSDAERYLVGSIEEQADDVTVVSPGSPMGAALLGASVGDEVAYEAPTGAMLKVKVLTIDCVARAARLARIVAPSSISGPRHQPAITSPDASRARCAPAVDRQQVGCQHRCPMGSVLFVRARRRVRDDHHDPHPDHRSR